MELCCPPLAPSILAGGRRWIPLVPALLRPAAAFRCRKTLAARSDPGHRPRAADFEETSTVIVSEKFENVSDRTAYASVEAAPREDVSTEQAPAEGGEQSGPVDFLSKLDSEGANNVLIYGGGALFALWMTSAIVGALDSIPLFPKVMEAIGLGFTVWFSTRYLIFKGNRDELLEQIGRLKEQIIGSDDE